MISFYQQKACCAASLFVWNIIFTAVYNNIVNPDEGVANFIANLKSLQNFTTALNNLFLSEVKARSAFCTFTQEIGVYNPIIY